MSTEGQPDSENLVAIRMVAKIGRFYAFFGERTSRRMTLTSAEGVFGVLNPNPASKLRADDVSIPKIACRLQAKRKFSLWSAGHLFQNASSG